MDGVTRYRPRWRQFAVQVAALLLGIAANLLRGDASGRVVAVMLVLAGLVAASTWRRFGVDVRPDALVLRGLRTRTFPWASVQDVRVRSMLGTRYVSARAGGRSWMLRAPTHTPVLAPDPEFEAKVEALVTRWRAARAT